jgi:hypothetical protein
MICRAVPLNSYRVAPISFCHCEGRAAQTVDSRWHQKGAGRPDLSVPRGGSKLNALQSTLCLMRVPREDASWLGILFYQRYVIPPRVGSSVGPNLNSWPIVLILSVPFFRRAIAQLGERVGRNDEAVGSSPSSSTNNAGGCSIAFAFPKFSRSLQPRPSSSPRSFCDLSDPGRRLWTDL